MSNFENIVNSILEESSDYRPFLKFYKAFERKIIPDTHIIDECLYIMEEYYDDYIKWYDKYGTRRTSDKKIYKDYRIQLDDIRRAIRSSDIGKKIETVDTAINRWHHDYPVVVHMAMQALQETEDDDLADEMEEGWYKVSDVLKALGRLPEQSPYKK